MNLKNEIYELSRREAVHTIWILSDVQQYSVEKTRELMDIVTRDFPYMAAEPDALWFLGDAMQKKNNSAILDKITETVCSSLDAFRIPVCAVLGNHDMDYAREWDHESRMFLWEEAQRRPNWKTIARPSDLYFSVPLGKDWKIYFFSDGMAEDHAWWTTHGIIQGDAAVCPWNDEKWNGIREEIRQETRRVITAAHYAFPGGNRPSPLMARLMPLPSSVKMHFYGHAHISELSVCYESAFKRMGWTDWHDIPQFDCASISNRSGSYSRSVLVHLYENGSAGVFWRNHDAHRFEEFYITSADTMKEGLSDYLATHPDYRWYR